MPPHQLFYHRVGPVEHRAYHPDDDANTVRNDSQSFYVATFRHHPPRSGLTLLCDRFLEVWTPEYRDHQTNVRTLHSTSSCKTV